MRKIPNATYNFLYKYKVERLCSNYRIYEWIAASTIYTEKINKTIFLLQDLWIVVKRTILQIFRLVRWNQKKKRISICATLVLHRITFLNLLNIVRTGYFYVRIIKHVDSVFTCYHLVSKHVIGKILLKGNTAQNCNVTFTTLRKILVRNARFCQIISYDNYTVDCCVLRGI